MFKIAEFQQLALPFSGREPDIEVPHGGEQCPQPGQGDLPIGLGFGWLYQNGLTKGVSATLYGSHKIHMAVFAPNGRQLVGFLVARPDVAGMVKREDAFLAWDSFEPCERGIVVTRPDDGLDDAARKRLGLDWDKCIMWAGMDARTRSGKVLGYVNDVEFDLKTGRAKTFYIGDGGMARALVGSFEIPAEMVIGYSAADQFMVVSDDAENLAVDGGVAAKAGEAWASAKVKGAEVGHKAGAAASEAVDKGLFRRTAITART